jgi:hypothetical protein
MLKVKRKEKKKKDNTYNNPLSQSQLKQPQNKMMEKKERKSHNSFTIHISSHLLSPHLFVPSKRTFRTVPEKNYIQYTAAGDLVAVGLTAEA